MTASQPRFFLPMSVLFTSVFSVAGIFVMFYALFLNDRGLSTTQIGYAMSAMALAKITSVLMVAFVIDKSRSPHLYLVSAACCAMVMMGLVYLFDIQGSILIPLTFFYSLAWSMNVPLSEGFAMRACRLDKSLNYGRMRLFGSISFLIAGLVMGELIEHHDNNYDLFLLGIIIAMIFTAYTGARLPNFYELEQKARIVDKATIDAQGLLKMITHNIPLMVIIGGASVMHAGHAVLFQYAPVSWGQQGYSNIWISYFMGIGVVIEVIVFWFARSIDKRLRTIDYFMIAGLGSIIRWTAMGFNPQGGWILFFQSFHAFSFAMLHLGVIRYIKENLAGNYHGAAQLIYGGMMWGVAMIPATALAGYVCSHYQQGAYFFMAGLAALGTGIVLIPFYKKNLFKKQQTISYVTTG